MVVLTAKQLTHTRCSKRLDKKKDGYNSEFTWHHLIKPFCEHFNGGEPWPWQLHHSWVGQPCHCWDRCWENNPITIYDAIDVGSNKKGAHHFAVEDSTIRYSSTYLLFLMAHIFSKAARFKKSKYSDLIVFAHDVTKSRGVTRVGFPIQMHQTFWGMTVPSFSPSFNVPRSVTQNGMVSRLGSG